MSRSRRERAGGTDRFLPHEYDRVATGGSRSRYVTAVFHDLETARKAVRELELQGIPPNDVSIVVVDETAHPHLVRGLGRGPDIVVVVPAPSKSAYEEACAVLSRAGGELLPDMNGAA